MKLVFADIYKDFRCLAGACPDSCCAQGWEIPVDEAHVEFYSTMSGPLGEKVRAAMKEQDGETVLKMENGKCTLLQEDGLCPIAAKYGEDGLCHICHTHPRFLEQYGATREIHFSLSCPEAARLLLAQNAPIAFFQELTDEDLTEYNSIDPDEYMALMGIRETAIAVSQNRTYSVFDRMAVLLHFANRIQGFLDEENYAACQTLCENYKALPCRVLAASKRIRLKGTSYFPEVNLFLSLEHLTEEFPKRIHDCVFTAADGKEFDEACQTVLEHLLTLWLWHYIPKAVNDGRADTKIRFAVLMSMAVRRMCLCQKKYAPEDAVATTGLLAKEIEHSQENLQLIWKELEGQVWYRHLLQQLPTNKKGAHHAV